MAQKEKKLQLIRMADVPLTEVKWLWYPFIPFGKITIIQGNPGEGKTTLALRMAAMCSTGRALPGMESQPSFNILYQTAEDGLGDTIKPRLMEAQADLSKIFCIDETDRSLSLLDVRIGQAIRDTRARLMILDPLQAYLSQKVDMTRANEIRDVLKRLSIIAEQSGCAMVLIGHLNKALGASSAYRGLGSIDFRAAARSVLLVGRMKKEPSVRVIVHDKSSLAPEGKSRAFSLDEDGFHWVDGYENIKADELLNGGPAETKVDAAEKLIQETLAGGRAVPAREIYRLAEQAGISKRTLKIAKDKMRDSIETVKRGDSWQWMLKC